MRNESLSNEGLLLQQLCAGNEEAFNAVFNHYHPVLLHHARSILKSDELAEDVCSEVFENIWSKRGSLTNITSLRNYLLTAVRNRSFNALKSLVRSKEVRNEIAATFNTTSFSAEAYVLQKEYADFIKKHIEELPPRAREVYLLCREEGFSYDEAASQLGISRNAIKSHMVYSIKRLKLSVEKAFGIFLLLLFLIKG